MHRNLLVISSALGLVMSFLVASQAHASKARLTALQFADFWRDNQNIFNYPQYASDLGQYATFELGPTGTMATGVHAEGGFARKTSEGIMGIYFGHYNTTLNTLYTGAGVGQQNNPFFLYYAKGNWGAGLNFSFSDIKSTTNKEFSIGGTWGYKGSSFDFGSNLTVYSKSETGAVNAKILPSLELDINTTKSTCKWYGQGIVARTDVGGATDTSFALRGGVQDHLFKLGEKGTFFYGTELGYTKRGTAKNLNLPIYLGIEADVTTWATVRGALSQTLIGFIDAGTGTKDLNTNSTLATLGAGFKTGNFELDGLLAAGTSGAINGTTFLTSSSLTYHF